MDTRYFFFQNLGYWRVYKNLRFEWFCFVVICIVRPSSQTVPGLSWPYQVCITSKEGRNKCEIYDPKQPLPRGNDFWGKDWKY